MANWKKVIVSGSAAQLNQLSVDTSVNITGSLNASSSVFLKGLTNSPQATILSIDAATGQLFYQGTGSFTANSASYATTASFASTASSVNPLNQTVVIAGGLDVTGSTTLSGSLGVTGSQTVTGSLSVDGATTLTGSVSIAATTQISGSLNVTGSTILSGSLGVTGSQIITGSLSVDGATTLTGSLSIAAAAQISGSLNVTGSTVLSGSLGVTGSQTITGSLGIDGATTITGSLSIAAAAQISGSLNVTGSTVLSGSLGVTGSQSITGSLNVDGATTLTGSLSIAAAAQISGSLNVTGSTILSGSTTISGSFDQSGTVFLRGLTEVSKSYVVGYDNTTGQLTYQTAVDNADTASFAVSASFAQSGNGAFSGSFSGSFQGNGSGLTDVPASGIVGLQLNQIGSGSVTASIAPDLGFRVNTNSQITGSLIVTGNINTGGSVISTVAGSSLTGSFTGSFAGDFTGTANLPDLTQGAGVTAFTYDGSTTATVAVSGASALSATTLPKWTGDAFANSSITDSTNVVINNAGGVLIQAGGLYVTGASTFHDNVVMQGNLTVQGTASFQNVTNLAVKDQFVLLNSGSSTFQDSGIVINTGNAANSGSAFFLETAGTTTGTNGLYGRFAVGIDVLPDATTATAAEYANTTVISGSAPGNAVPQFGGTGLGQGNTWVDTTTSDIWIYA